MEEQKEPTSTSTSQGGGGRTDVQGEKGTDVKQRFSPAGIVDDEHERKTIKRASLNENLALSNDLVVVVSDDKHTNDA